MGVQCVIYNSVCVCFSRSRLSSCVVPIYVCSVLAMATLVLLRLVCCCIMVDMYSGDCNRDHFSSHFMVADGLCA